MSLRAALVLLGAVTLGAGEPPAPSEQLDHSGEARVGSPAPWFAGWTLDNRILNRRHLLGAKGVEATVLVFFATWCKPCEAGLSALRDARPRLDAAGVRIVLVDLREEAAAVRPWLAARKLDGFDIVLDRFGKAAQTFGASSIEGGVERTQLPRTISMDASGVVRLIVGREGPDFVDAVLASAGPPKPPPAPQR